MSADLFAAFADQITTKSADVPVQGETQASASTSPAKLRLEEQGFLPEERQISAIASPLWKKDTHGSDVLFDAEDAQHEDDFGEFEDVTSVAVVPQGHSPAAVCALPDANHTVERHSLNGPLANLDLLSLADEQGEAQWKDANATHDTECPRTWPGVKPVTTEEEDWGEFENVQAQAESSQLSGADIQGARKAIQRDQRSLTVNPAQVGASCGSSNNLETTYNATQKDYDESADDWDVFEDGTPSAASAIAPGVSSSIKGIGEQESTQAQATHQRTARPSNTERPTNIPPPVMLLQMLCSTFDHIHSIHMNGSESKETVACRILTAVRVANRIIAGRTHRWKRDTILAQNMRIGQAGKSGGMKLATVNKGESVREQREVAELTSQWSKYTHEFQSVIAQAHKSANRLKLNAAPTLHVISGQDRSKQCALCGLKRSERITDVDVDMQDLFDEFWIEHWGHQDCSEIWYTYKHVLDQR
ncbi:hypothetical protein PV10_08959 [Exophiala mesophila]|uniref:Uncharacterized protein n=1 Tax=Exophiala mesophila TaxID=212818 RepID=A0A0D1WKC8_EXOME|nr:uncharacterized protein PV10_08959 [Exophiala mesophila]KIV89395.1 hypothetical protein PV10_08959 [Exophiala mesophila]